MPAPTFTTHPWKLREHPVDPDALAVSESVLALSNGHLGIRGTLDEGSPSAFRGTFLAGVHETHPLSYPESGYGQPDEGQAMIAVADGTPIRATVDGVPLDVRELAVEHHERTLDLRTGALERILRWTAASGTTLELRSRRVVSLTHRAVAAIRWELRALDGPAHVTVRSELVVGASPPEISNADPRVAEALDHPFEALALRPTAAGGALGQRTRRTRIGIGAAVAHDVDGDLPVTTEIEDRHVVGTVSADLIAGQSLAMTKTLGYAWSFDTPADTLLERAAGAVEQGRAIGFDGLVAAQRAVLDDLWETADVEIDGDDELQQALRYGVFQLFCAAACIEGAPVGAKGLTGAGYSGHTFWDIEGFVVPALSLLRPEAAERLLRWRASTLPKARERADVLELRGAAFAWRTIDGRETSAYWPASTAAAHLNADISRAFWLHGHVTGTGPLPLGGAEILMETARLWMSMGHTDAEGGWHLFGVTGPDEYTGVVDDNVFTNLMAARNLRGAADAARDCPDVAAALEVDDEEIERWRTAADAVAIPFDARLGVHPMNENFTTYREWRFEDKRNSYPIQEHQHYAKFYRRQVLKQADMVLALWWCREFFSPEQVARDVDYYEARTVRDSSLSASVQTVVCAQAQHPDLALRYLRETALVDLKDIRADTAQGLHLASVGGTWLALVAGLGGMREDQEDLELAPLLPSTISRIAYHLTWRGDLLQVETTRDGSEISLPRGGGPVTVVVDGEPIQVNADRPARVRLRGPDPLLPEPTQPAGREPTA